MSDHLGRPLAEEDAADIMFSVMSLASLITEGEAQNSTRRERGAQALPAGLASGLGGAAFSIGTLPEAKVLPLGLATLDEVLPDGGLPRGVVIEVSAPRGLARATTIGLAACASAQAEARLRGADDTVGAWCAWIDPTMTLFAPGVAQAGVDLTRLLVVRPPLEALARVTVRIAASRAFTVIVVDAAGVPGAPGLGAGITRWTTIVRRLALAIEGSDTALLLLTDHHVARPMPLPVAMRLEIDRPGEDRMTLRVAKDRRGRVSSPRSIRMPSIPNIAKSA